MEHAHTDRADVPDDFAAYLEGAARTMPEDLGPRDLLADAALGLCGEAGEIREASSGDERDDEIGDGWWYVAAAYRALAVEPEDVRRSSGALDASDLFSAASRIAEAAKKIRYHRDPVDEHRDEIVEALRTYATALSQSTDTPDRRIWADNLAKLRGRYPDGFDPEEA